MGSTLASRAPGLRPSRYRCHAGRSSNTEWKAEIMATPSSPAGPTLELLAKSHQQRGERGVKDKKQ